MPRNFRRPRGSRNPAFSSEPYVQQYFESRLAEEWQKLTRAAEAAERAGSHPQLANDVVEAYQIRKQWVYHEVRHKFPWAQRKPKVSTKRFDDTPIPSLGANSLLNVACGVRGKPPIDAVYAEAGMVSSGSLRDPSAFEMACSSRWSAVKEQMMLRSKLRCRVSSLTLFAAATWRRIFSKLVDLCCRMYHRLLLTLRVNALTSVAPPLHFFMVCSGEADSVYADVTPYWPSCGRLWHVVHRGTINIRSAPSLHAKIVGTLSFGDKFRAFEVQNGFLSHEYGWSVLEHQGILVCQPCSDISQQHGLPRGGALGERSDIYSCGYCGEPASISAGGCYACIGQRC